MSDNSSVLSGLAKVGALVAETIRKNARNKRVPKVPEAVFVDSPKISTGGKNLAQISIEIDIDKAPAARAFEWGSGIHAEIGEKNTYPIKPRKVGLLGIPQEKWPGFQPPVRLGPKMKGFAGGKYILTYVDHPGVEARPYIRPAIKDTIPQVIAILGTSVKAYLTTNMVNEEIIIK